MSRFLIERVRKVFSIHPEFEDLPVVAQRNVLKTNVSLGLALFVARSELLTGIEHNINFFSMNKIAEL